MPLTRGTIRSYNSTTGLSDVEIVDGPRAVLSAVPYARDFPLRWRAAGHQVLMEYYPDLGPVIIAQWRAQPQANLQAWLYDANAMVFNTAAWVTYAGLSHTVTLTESSMLWLHAVIAWSASAVRLNAIGWRITVDTTQINPGVIEQEPQVNGQQVTTLSMMAGPYAAGSHTIDVQGYRVNAGDTVTAQYSGSGYLAIPNG